LYNLPRLREIGFRANRRLLEVERLSYDCILAEQTFQRINRPVEHAGQRASGLRFADPRIDALWHALVLFGLLPKGFRRTDPGLRRGRLCVTIWPNSAAAIPKPSGQRAMTYQLRRLAREVEQLELALVELLEGIDWRMPRRT
jgi:hypothetical protein